MTLKEAKEKLQGEALREYIKSYAEGYREGCLRAADQQLVAVATERGIREALEVYGLGDVRDLLEAKLNELCKEDVEITLTTEYGFSPEDLEGIL